jgi:hypothetical protein
LAPVSTDLWRFLPYAHLAYAVRGFFENGGRACWVVRIADFEAARPARAEIPAESGGPAYRVQAVNPGTWGNSLAVSFQRASLGSSQHIVIPGLNADWLALANIAGFEAGSRVQLTQRKGALVQASLRVTGVDEALGVLVIPGLAAHGLEREDSDHPISVQSQEFTLLVWQADGTAERHPGLAPDPEHTRYAPRLVNRDSLLVTLDKLARRAADGMPGLAGGVRYPLSGGIDGLRSLEISDYTGAGLEPRRGLSLLETVDEVSILVMPDLTSRPAAPDPAARPQDPCALDLPRRIDRRSCAGCRAACRCRACASAMGCRLRPAPRTARLSCTVCSRWWTCFHLEGFRYQMPVMMETPRGAGPGRC